EFPASLENAGLPLGLPGGQPTAPPLAPQQPPTAPQPGLCQLLVEGSEDSSLSSRTTSLLDHGQVCASSWWRALKTAHCPAEPHPSWTQPDSHTRQLRPEAEGTGVDGCSTSARRAGHRPP
ncbi:hypothetical protein H1C71_021198, partial [Ictidomys tridecemlineatus]